VTLVAAKTPPQPQGKAFYLPEARQSGFSGEQYAGVAAAEGL